jgi:hypothetical protein
MASVTLQFQLPADPDIASLRIYESPTPDGTFTLIEEVDEIGTYPNYITDYVTQNATNEDNWFAISWVDSGGSESDLSTPVQGGTDSVVHQIVERVYQRAPSLSKNIVIQEAEAVVEQYFGMNPYTVPLPVSYRVLTGLTYITMARASLSQQAHTSISSSSFADSWTAGLVSMKAESGSGSQSEIQQASFDWLISEANKMLGLGMGVIAQMATPEIAGGMTVIEPVVDQSRLIVATIE